MGTLRDAVDEATAALPLMPQDIALKCYALQLAEALDEAERVARFAARCVTLWERDGTDPDLGEALQALRAKLSRRETLDRLGTNLHRALVELGASPRARAKGEAPKTVDPGKVSRLSAFKGGAA